jgi:hypothetical protein
MFGINPWPALTVIEDLLTDGPLPSPSVCTAHTYLQYNYLPGLTGALGAHQPSMPVGSQRAVPALQLQVLPVALRLRFTALLKAFPPRLMLLSFRHHADSGSRCRGRRHHRCCC